MAWWRLAGERLPIYGGRPIKRHPLASRCLNVSGLFYNAGMVPQFFPSTITRFSINLLGSSKPFPATKTLGQRDFTRHDLLSRKVCCEHIPREGVSAMASQQHVHGLAAQLPQQVPQGKVHSANGLDGKALATVVDASAKHLILSEESGNSGREPCGAKLMQ